MTEDDREDEIDEDAPPSRELTPKEVAAAAAKVLEIKRAALAKVRAQMVEQRAIRDAATRRIVELEAQDVEMSKDLEPKGEPEHIANQRGIREWLDGQQKLRAARGARSPIDQAHARPSARGGRPSFTVKP